MTRAWTRILGLTPGELAWLVAGIGLLAYELVAAANGRDGIDVLTRAWRANSLRWIVIPLGAGVLMGHLNGPSLPYFSKWSPAIFVALLVAGLAYGLFVRTPVPAEARLPLFVVGFIVGIVAWSGRP